MNSLPEGYRALVIGATGTIGAAFVELLSADPRCAQVVRLGRKTAPALDLTLPESIAAAAHAWAQGPGFDLIVLATGILHRAEFMPEKVSKP